MELRLKEVFNLNLKLCAANKGTVMLLPLFSLVARYITFDSTRLYKILLECERHNNTGYSKASVAFSGMSTAEIKAMTKSDAQKKRKTMRDSASSAPSTSKPSSSAPASSKPRCKCQRAHSPVSLPEQPLPPPVSSTEPALMDADPPDEQPPPPPTPTTELPLIDVVDPPDEQPVYTEKEMKAALVLLRAKVTANTCVVPIPASISFEDISAHIDSAADALAARRQQGDEDYAQIVAGRAAARKAATFDIAEIYREDRRTVVSKARIEEVLIAYETTIKDAEAAAVRPLTEAATADLHTAYNDAMDAATYGLRVAHSITMDVIDAEDCIIAATRAAMRNPNHVHIGGDPGVVTFCTFARLNDPKWRCSFSTKQYHADIGSTWRAEKMGEFVDKLGLRVWLSKTPTSKTVSSKETLDLLRYLYATDKFALHLKMHQSLR
ncbi:hypothetical protein FBU31_004005, partial [Coemansia sp. 'formosensis']